MSYRQSVQLENVEKLPLTPRNRIHSVDRAHGSLKTVDEALHRYVINSKFLEESYSVLRSMKKELIGSNLLLKRCEFRHLDLK